MLFCHSLVYFSTRFSFSFWIPYIVTHRFYIYIYMYMCVYVYIFIYIIWRQYRISHWATQKLPQGKFLHRDSPNNRPNIYSWLGIKGAVCRILTLLKHKNTIICLQIFKKHAKLTYLFIWKTMLQSVILLWKCAVRPGMSVCYGLWNPPTASLPNCISAPRVASWRKTQRM